LLPIVNRGWERSWWRFIAAFASLQARPPAANRAVRRHF